jgi:hypothetical protein
VCSGFQADAEEFQNPPNACGLTDTQANGAGNSIYDVVSVVISLYSIVFHR